MNWRNHTQLLQNWLTKSRIGIVTDMDGTLSPIVPKPDDARVTPTNLTLLKQLAARFTLVGVVSGRAVQDIVTRVGLPELTYIGNHGMEHWVDESIVVSPEITAYRPNLQAAIATLETQLVDGMWIEDKQTTLSIHYRNTSNPIQIADIFKPVITSVANQNNLRAFSGRMIFEIRPSVDINKGTAFKYLVTQHQLDAAIFVGDDTTDVDAFIVAKQLREANECYCFAVGVESEDMPPPVAENADITVSGVSGVESLFSWLLSASSASST